ncbi:MAG: hypothetical protein WBA20_09110 [Ketobacter sp.]
MANMQKVHLFSVIGYYQMNDEPRVQLLLQGHTTGRKLKGRQLVDQYSTGERYILITSDDNPFDEVLHIYLLDLELNILDEMNLSQPYTPGVYEAFRHYGEHLEFRFFSEGIWCLKVRSRPKHAPLNLDQYPVSRPIKLWGQQYLSLQKSKNQVA